MTGSAMNREATTPQELESLLVDYPAAVVWFSTPDCSVCHALRPRVEALLAEEFPRAALIRVDAAAHPELAGQWLVTAAPTAVICLEGREHQQLSRSFGIDAVRQALARPYGLLFDQ